METLLVSLKQPEYLAQLSHMKNRNSLSNLEIFFMFSKVQSAHGFSIWSAATKLLTLQGRKDLRICTAENGLITYRIVSDEQLTRSVDGLSR